MALQDFFRYPVKSSTIVIPTIAVCLYLLFVWAYNIVSLTILATAFTSTFLYAYHRLLSIIFAGWLPEKIGDYTVAPGPEFKPFVGHFLSLFVQPDLHIRLIDLGKQYGNIIKLQFGPTPAFIVRTRKLTQKLFDSKDNKEIVLRTDFFDTAYTFGRDKDILISNGEAWNVNRKGFHKAMLGIHAASEGVQSYLNRTIEEEAVKVRQRVSNGKPFIVSEEFIETTFNILVRSLVGRLATPEEKAVIVQLQTEFPRPCLAEIFHTIPEFLIDKMFENRHAQVKVMVDDINKILDEWISHPTGDECLIARLKKANGVDEISLRGMVMDMFVAGYDSVKYHMTWYLHLITMHPEVQQKLQYLLEHDPREYDEYFNQVYKEVMRYRPIMLSGIWYKNTEDIILEEDGVNYIFPKKSYLFYDTWAIHHNKEFWGDPENFRPDRFGPGGVSSTDFTQNYIGFFLGRRSCLGEKMAKEEIKEVITELIRHHTFVSDVPMDDHTFVQTIMAQKPFYLRATEKKSTHQLK
jgi:methyl farnesoate epoxidase/farnesoate epoxidase